MNEYNPIDRVREREDSGPDRFEQAKETYTIAEAQCERELPPEQMENESEEEFKERMQRKLAQTRGEDPKKG